MPTTAPTKPTETLQDSVARMRDEKLSGMLANEKILAEIESKQSDIEYGKLQLTAAERCWFDDQHGADNDYEIIHLLCKQRNLRQWREKWLGSPAAKAARAAAAKAHDDAVPALHAEREKIDAKIIALANAKAQTQKDDEYLDVLFERLRGSAPEALKREIGQDMNYARLTSPIWAELRAVRHEIHDLEGTGIATGQLADLRTQEQSLLKQWDEYVAPIESRLTRWAETGSYE